MKTAYLFVGMPGCGKSYAAAELLKVQPELAVIERDAIRKKMYLEEGKEFSWDSWDFGREGEVTAIVDSEIAEAAAAGRDIVISDTNLNPVYRRRFYTKFKKLNYRIELWVFGTSEELYRSRNSNRDPSLVVNDAAMAKMKELAQTQLLKRGDKPRTLLQAIEDEVRQYGIKAHLLSGE